MELLTINQLDINPLIVDTQLLNHINSNYKYTEILKVTGDSMCPFINDDSLIFVDISIKDINSKDIFVVNVDNEIFIKQITFNDDVYRLKSLNKDYEDIKVKDIVVIGKVKGVLNKI